MEWPQVRSDRHRAATLGPSPRGWWLRLPTKSGPGTSSPSSRVRVHLISRCVVAWMVATRESAGRPRRPIQAACRQQAIEPGKLTLHQDRGAPDDGQDLLATAGRISISWAATAARGRPTPTPTRRASSEPSIRANVLGPLCRPGAGTGLPSTHLPDLGVRTMVDSARNTRNEENSIIKC